MARVQSEHRYEYPSVHEIKIQREPSGPEYPMEELEPRIMAHRDRQVAYYSEQLEKALEDRETTLQTYSGQLCLDFGPAPEAPGPPPCETCEGECKGHV